MATAAIGRWRFSLVPPDKVVELGYSPCRPGWIVVMSEFTVRRNLAWVTVHDVTSKIALAEFHKPMPPQPDKSAVVLCLTKLLEEHTYLVGLRIAGGREARAAGEQPRTEDAQLMQAFVQLHMTPVDRRFGGANDYGLYSLEEDYREVLELVGQRVLAAKTLPEIADVFAWWAPAGNVKVVVDNALLEVLKPDGEGILQIEVD